MIKTYIGLHVKCCTRYCTILTKIEFPPPPEIFSKNVEILNPSSGSGVVPSGWTNGQDEA